MLLSQRADVPNAVKRFSMLDAQGRFKSVMALGSHKPDDLKDTSKKEEKFSILMKSTLVSDECTALRGGLHEL
ncbi:hypothetical protein Tco_1185607 [Tanacetum coccineum]